MVHVNRPPMARTTMYDTAAKTEAHAQRDRDGRPRQVILRLGPEVLAPLDVLAFARGQARSHLVADALRHYLSQHAEEVRAAMDTWNESHERQGDLTMSILRRL